MNKGSVFEIAVTLKIISKLRRVNGLMIILGIINGLTPVYFDKVSKSLAVYTVIDYKHSVALVGK